VLPDEVLLAIFYFYVDEASDTAYSKNDVEKWQTLAHVCWRWRGVVFGSPRRLNLRLACTPRKPARDSLNIWPALPLFILSDGQTTGDLDNITAVLKRSGDRVCQIKLTCPKRSQLKTILAAMQAPFPALTHLQLSSFITVHQLPNSFLGGSAPRLRLLDMWNIPLPGLPTLLLSATHLVDLHLYDIPQPGYTSPEAMVTILSTLTSLRSLSLEFSSSLTLPDWESLHSPLSTRSVLPVFTFCFEGFRKYLEDFVARIDVPQLDLLSINFFNDTVFDIPQFLQLISRTLTLKAFERAHVCFGTRGARLSLSSRKSGYGVFIVRMRCSRSDFQVSFMEQVCTSCLPPVSGLEDLYIFKDEYSYDAWQSDIDITVWLELLHPFSGVKNLYLCKKFAPHIVPALQGLVGGRVTEMLPTLQNIFLEASRPVQEGIEQLIATRQVANHPIAVSHWEDSKRDKAGITHFLPIWGRKIERVVDLSIN
jgi:F-box-like